MRCFEFDEDKLEQSLETLRTPCLVTQLPPMTTASVCTDSSLPPLSSLSVCSSPTADDSSSVSSVSIEDDEGWGEKRYIFGSYWNKKGGRPQQALHTSIINEDLTVDSSSNSSTTSSDASVADQSYEKLLEKHEAVRVRDDDTSSSSRSSGVRRRQLWDNRYVSSQSEPSLAQCFGAVERPCLRKVQSSSAAGRPSCLRASRYSGSSKATLSSSSRRSSESSAVSFKEEVQVKYLKPVTENWAASGWSKYFM